MQAIWDPAPHLCNNPNENILHLKPGNIEYVKILSQRSTKKLFFYTEKNDPRDITSKKSPQNSYTNWVSFPGRKMTPRSIFYGGHFSLLHGKGKRNCDCDVVKNTCTFM